MTESEVVSSRKGVQTQRIGDGMGSTVQNGSSSAAAVARLQKLGVGSVTGNRIPTQPASSSALATSKGCQSQTRSELIDIELAVDDIAIEPKLPVTPEALPERVYHAGNFSLRNKKTPARLAQQRHVAEDKLKHFHRYAGSLIAILVCSTWLFSYVMFS